MKVHNLGKEIDNLHKNIVDVKDKRGIKTSARDYIGSVANSDLIIEEQKKRRINDFNLELGSRAYRYTIRNINPDIQARLSKYLFAQIKTM